MACEIISGTGTVFSLWGIEPSRTDVDRVFEAMRVARERASRPIVYITRVPIDAPAPDADVRRHLDSLMPRVLEYCSTYHVILEGAGFVAAVKRSVLVGMFQIRWRNGTFFVHATGDEVVQSVPHEQRAAVELILQRARTLGLFHSLPGASESNHRAAE